MRPGVEWSGKLPCTVVQLQNITSIFLTLPPGKQAEAMAWGNEYCTHLTTFLAMHNTVVAERYLTCANHNARMTHVGMKEGGFPFSYGSLQYLSPKRP